MQRVAVGTGWSVWRIDAPGSQLERSLGRTNNIPIGKVTRFGSSAEFVWKIVGFPRFDGAVLATVKRTGGIKDGLLAA